MIKKVRSYKSKPYCTVYITLVLSPPFVFSPGFPPPQRPATAPPPPQVRLCAVFSKISVRQSVKEKVTVRQRKVK